MGFEALEVSSHFLPYTRVLPRGHRRQITICRTQLLLSTSGIWAPNLVFGLVGQ